MKAALAILMLVVSCHRETRPVTVRDVEIPDGDYVGHAVRGAQPGTDASPPDRWKLTFDRERRRIRITGGDGAIERALTRVPSTERPVDCGSGGVGGPGVPMSPSAMRLDSYRIDGELTILGVVLRAPMIVAECTGGVMIVEDWRAAGPAFKSIAVWFERQRG